ncbi:NfeD family protein [Emticicia sp. CRIBPO]|uniref:NfeD family protein n=1 Tax=Emticicia sp. CRIBPO TaxID=2683258 RepID=UPI001411F9B1|nr:NfeD family protein [Emticicia sp. CRIBPO]NBA88533.1 NfeD family protein [Emticicia sp. CRIBPO]
MDLSNVTIWVIVGVIMLIVEIFSTSFYSIFFGVGAFITAVFSYLGLLDETSAQLIVFCFSSVISLVLFRKKFKELFLKEQGSYTEFIDEHARVSVEIPVGGEGKVFYRGSEWMAFSDSLNSLLPDEKVIIKKIEGIKLFVVKQS